ncbi:MAG: methyltransferase domain-containing protein [Flavisolibacter sp.]|nr:methyltransferase domain-containing protein [Flavisolibacter sp.]
MNFQQRSYQKELLDQPSIPFADIKRNMQELNVINQWLGGHRITLKGVQALLNHSSSEVRIMEIGCGGGDNLRIIKNWALKNARSVQLTGVDINPECIAFAQQQLQNKGITFICSDYRQLTVPERPHIIFSSLFCHHFTEEELIFLLQWKWYNSTCGFFINDLHRHPFAYYSIKVLTRLFSKSYLVINDAPLSVQRGFVKEEWQALLQKAGIADCSIKWQWAFRWLIIGKKNAA